MKKLAKKNYVQENSIQGYLNCLCWCNVCSCKVVNFLKIGSDQSSNGNGASTVNMR